ncbi:dynein light chain Tctex-type protein 2B isoform X2 [Chelonia mydas]|uniref:dynein light chain Tctex-type protein 2B isoform X2 n=1 Tax=Chelonia mydas TaxID=8469 RepID=UPI0018A1F61C|nr:dynein light chain Tctex-type protein 2B isoform X2 [Chelonia mydas]
MGEPLGQPSLENSYSLRPAFQHKFRSSAVKECIHAILKENLANVQYNPEETPGLTRSLSETIKDRLKGCRVNGLSQFICLAWLRGVSGMLTLTTMPRMFLLMTVCSAW